MPIAEFRAAVPAKVLRLLCEVGMAPLAMLQVARAGPRVTLDKGMAFREVRGVLFGVALGSFVWALALLHGVAGISSFSAPRISF